MIRQNLSLAEAKAFNSGNGDVGAINDVSYSYRYENRKERDAVKVESMYLKELGRPTRDAYPIATPGFLNELNQPRAINHPKFQKRTTY